jgi:hypothetical protein
MRLPWLREVQQGADVSAALPARTTAEQQQQLHGCSPYTAHIRAELESAKRRHVLMHVYTQISQVDRFAFFIPLTYEDSFEV